MCGAGLERWSGVAYQRHDVGVGDCHRTGGGLRRL